LRFHRNYKIQIILSYALCNFCGCLILCSSNYAGCLNLSPHHTHTKILARTLRVNNAFYLCMRVAKRLWCEQASTSNKNLSEHHHRFVAYIWQWWNVPERGIGAEMNVADLGTKTRGDIWDARDFSLLWWWYLSRAARAKGFLLPCTSALQHPAWCVTENPCKEARQRTKVTKCLISGHADCDKKEDALLMFCTWK
jgi:hypothetical protein